MGGIFTISLDFELHWGVFDKKDRDRREDVYRTTLDVIPKMLDLFDEHGIHATWAVVGSLFARDEYHWHSLKPHVLPDYEQERYSAYRYVDEHGIPEKYHYAHFAPEMIALINSCDGQEVGTHTFSHFYCLENQFNPLAFRSDLKAALDIAARTGITISSLVFPRNQFNPDCLKVCLEHGITSVRSNPDTWFWNPVNEKKSTLTRKIIRSSDAYIQLGDKRTSYPLSSISVVPGEPLKLPASRFLRPWSSKYQFANAFRINRICNELKSAAIHDECYHLWWHPENFGENADKNLQGLSQVLKKFDKYKKRFGMQSWNMREYADHLMPVKKLVLNAASLGY